MPDGQTSQTSPTSETSPTRHAIRSTAWLAILLFAVGLTTSRLGLVGHELGGHGGAAMALGGRVLAFDLFWFAGGWIRYRIPEPTITNQIIGQLGGIAIELVVGIALWGALARRASLAARLGRAVGAALIVHAAWYLATGTWHGFGDGTLLRRNLDGDARLAIAIVGGAVAVALAYVGARSIFGVLLARLPGKRTSRIAALAVAMALAGGSLAALAITELKLRSDVTYSTLMQPEGLRIAERELARWTEEQRRAGSAIDDRVRAERARDLARKHREWPFKYLLGALLGLAIVVGCARSPSHADAPLAKRTVLRATVLAIGSLALVIVLDAVLGL